MYIYGPTLLVMNYSHLMGIRIVVIIKIKSVDGSKISFKL